MKKTIIGIDPGASGGIAVIYPDGCAVASNYNKGDLASYLHNLNVANENIACYLEDITPMPIGGFKKDKNKEVKMNYSAQFNFGKSCGFVEGVLAGLQIPTELVRPQVWQKGLSGLKGLKGAERKRKLKEHAARIFPKQKPTLKTADALLIARYGKQMEK